MAAAADLQPVMPVLAQAYEHATGVKLVVSFGSSATLAEQILNGAPMDIFLGADFVYPEKVVAAGLADGTSPTPYARGTLVLWARKDSPLQPLSMELLTDPRVTRIAIANEMHAPYGRAAVSALRQLKLYDQTSPHFVIAENIAQTAQFVESGNAQVGFISLTLASSPKFMAEGTFVRLPAIYPEIQQCGVVLKGSKNEGVGLDFLRWLTTKEVQATLVTMGLDSVNGLR